MYTPDTQYVQCSIYVAFFTSINGLIWKFYAFVISILLWIGYIAYKIYKKESTHWELCCKITVALHHEINNGIGSKSSAMRQSVDMYASLPLITLVKFGGVLIVLH